MNLEVWESLPADQKAIVKAAAHAANNLSIAEFTHQNAIALQNLIEEHGVQLRTFSDDIWREVGRVSEEVVAEAANADALSRRVYNSYVQSRRRSREWANVSETPYLQKTRTCAGRLANAGG